MGEFESLEAVLVWITVGGGAMVIVGYVEAYLLENWAGWHGLSRWIKTLFPIVMAGALGIIAQSLLAFDLAGSVPPAVGTILLFAINWLSSQKAYKGIKEGAYGSAARLSAEDG